LHSIEVQLRRPTTNFQIYRDADWEQGFYPRATSSDHSGEVRGPDALGHGKNWQICGSVGDHFRIDFRRQAVDAADLREIRWAFVKSGRVDFEEEAKSHRYHYASSSTDFQSLSEMKLSEDGRSFSIEVVLDSSGIEKFQIFLNANALAAVRPSLDGATMHDGHTVEGPDNGGACRYWVMGPHPQDGLAPGSTAIVRLHIEDGLPKRVSWEKYAGADDQREYLSWGRTSIFERHPGFVGVSPWSQGALIGKTTEVVAAAE